MVSPVEFCVEQLARDRTRPVAEFCEELALVSRFSDELERRTSGAWWDVVKQAEAEGRVRVEGGLVSFVRRGGQESPPEQVQGVLF